MAANDVPELSLTSGSSVVVEQTFASAFLKRLSYPIQMGGIPLSEHSEGISCDWKFGSIGSVATGPKA
jgi:hypothetical protein